MCPLLKIESRFCTQVLRHSIMLSSVILFGQVSMMSPAVSKLLLLDMDVSINGRESDITLYRSERWTERSLNIAKRCLQLRQLWCHLDKKNDFCQLCRIWCLSPHSCHSWEGASRGRTVKGFPKYCQMHIIAHSPKCTLKIFSVQIAQWSQWMVTCNMHNNSAIVHVP